jgi:hypothetical protein
MQMRTRAKVYNFLPNVVIKKQKTNLLTKIKKLVKQNKDCKYLNKRGVVEWLFADKSFIQTLTKQKEDAWGKSLIGNNTNQWTTTLGENILKEILTLLGKNPTRVTVPLKGKNGKKLMPDFEGTDGLYENKARTFSTTGTAGEKILGTPLKYCECHRLYKKPLYIVCMGYQEQEADQSFQLFTPKSNELKSLLGFYEKNLNIKYVRATDLLKRLLV